jgi:hypothetical protein
VRGFIIALFIMSLAEYLSSPAGLCKIAYDSLDNALGGIKAALEAAVSNQDPGDALKPVSKEISTAKTFGVAAAMEPRGWKAKFKKDLVLEVADLCEYMRLDIGFMRSAMTGADGKTKGVFSVLSKLGKTFDDMHADLSTSMKDAQEVTNSLLKHEWGPCTAIDQLKSTEGTDTLDGWEQAVLEVNKVEGVAWPKDTIETLEDDLLIQISIIFLMLDAVNKRVSGVIKACVRES